MEPSLRDGDILLVRKCDLGVVPEAIKSLIVGDAASSRNTERARLLRHELLYAMPENAVARLYECPPVALPGHIVVYKDPLVPFTQVCVKRVIGVGGQVLRSDRLRQHVVSPYALHVEGDSTNSIDSRQLGPISKGLLVGVAEYLVWPPTRWKRLRRTPVNDANGSPRALWPREQW